MESLSLAWASVETPANIANLIIIRFHHEGSLTLKGASQRSTKGKGGRMKDEG